MESSDREQLTRAVLGEMRRLGDDVDAINGAAADYFAVNRTDARCMEMIVRDGPLTASQLAAAVGLTRGAATTAIDRMVAAGYANRGRDPKDGRRVIVEATEISRAASGALFDGLIHQARRLADDYEEAELRAILNFMQRQRRMLASHAAWIRTHPPRR